MPTVNKTDWNKEVGSKLRMLRQEVGWTQEHLAEMVDLSTRMIQKYEAGGENINVEKLGRFAKALSIPIVEFFQHSGELMPMQESERLLVEAFREINNAKVREGILQVVTHAAKVKE